MGTNRLFLKSKSNRLAFISLIFAGVMVFINTVNAGGGATIDLGIELRDGLGKEPVWVGLGILLFVYALIISEVVHRTLAAAIGGLSALAALNYYKKGAALSLAETTALIEWETIGLLLGMMIMVGIIAHTGIFEWFAVQAYKQSKGNVWSLVVILCVVTAVLSAFLDNVTTNFDTKGSYTIPVAARDEDGAYSETQNITVTISNSDARPEVSEFFATTSLGATSVSSGTI